MASIAASRNSEYVKGKCGTERHVTGKHESVEGCVGEDTSHPVGVCIPPNRLQLLESAVPLEPQIEAVYMPGKVHAHPEV